MRLAEEHVECLQEVAQDILTRYAGSRLLHHWKRTHMPHIEQHHQCSNGKESDRPGYAHVHAAVLQQPCQSHQTALTQHQTHTVEGVADAYVELLIDVGEAQDIEAIGRDVVCGTGKSDEHEQRQRSLKPHGSGQTECHSRQRGSHKQLHGEYPPAFGAEGITVHPRPDERHIRRSDVYELRPLLTTEFNIEGYPSPEFVDLVLKVKPHQVTLVPDAPDQITSNAGWDTKTNLSFLTELMDTFGQAGIRTSIFVGTDKEMIEYAAKAGADRVELYTEPYATMYPRNPEAAIAPFIEAAKVTRSLGMGLNAGHDLSLVNLKYMHTHIPWLDEVSIGHALISDALYMGLKQTIEEYKNCLRS